MVRRGVAEGGRRAPRRHRAGDVPEAGRAERFVERRPPPDTVAEMAHHDVDVVGERLGGGALGPAALVLEHLRQVPVVQRDVRLDAGVEQVVDEVRVEVEPGLRAARRGRWAAPAATTPRSGRRPHRGRGSSRTSPRRCSWWPHATSPLLPSTIAPGCSQKRSQMLSPRLARPPSIWNDDVAVPQTKPSGKRRRASPAALSTGAKAFASTGPRPAVMTFSSTAVPPCRAGCSRNCLTVDDRSPYGGHASTASGGTTQRARARKRVGETIIRWTG